MQELERVTYSENPRPQAICPSACSSRTRNEAHNLPRCLAALSGLGLGEIYVVDSQKMMKLSKSAAHTLRKVVQCLLSRWLAKKKRQMGPEHLSAHARLGSAAPMRATLSGHTVEDAHSIQDYNLMALYSLPCHSLHMLLRHGQCQFLEVIFVPTGKGTKWPAPGIRTASMAGHGSARVRSRRRFHLQIEEPNLHYNGWSHSLRTFSEA